MRLLLRVTLLLALAMFADTAGAQNSTAGALIPVESGQVWYQTCGSGPKAILLIHDSVLHSATWDDVWPILCRDFRVVRYDRRGVGRSPAATVSYSPVDDLAAVMHAAGLEHALVVGRSSGRGLAVDFTLQHPAAVDRLVLVGPWVSGFAVSQHVIDEATMLVQRLSKGDIDGALRGYRWAFAPGHDAARKHVVALLASNPQDIPQDIHDSDLIRHAPQAKPLLAAVKAPTLILVGEYDIA